jgi:hypothetical protein
MENKILEQIREKTIGASKNTQFDIREIETKYKIPNVTFLRSSHQFHIDPTPWNNWVIDGEKVRHGREIIELLKEKKIIPKSKEEALEIAKLILNVENTAIRIYPDFNAEGCKKPKVTFKNEIYEIILYVSHGFGFHPAIPVKVIIRLGESICDIEKISSLKKN